MSYWGRDLVICKKKEGGEFESLKGIWIILVREFVKLVYRVVRFGGGSEFKNISCIDMYNFYKNIYIFLR